MNIEKSYVSIIIIISCGSLLAGYITQSAGVILFNFIFLLGCFYFGKIMNGDTPKIFLFFIVLFINIFVAIIEIEGLKTNLFPIGCPYGTMLIFVGAIFFGKRTMHKY